VKFDQKQFDSRTECTSSGKRPWESLLTPETGPGPACPRSRRIAFLG
jgi:hypothetical protein